MRIRRIGTLVFNVNTNIVVDATNQDAPGIGFNANALFDPQPFAAEIAFRRETRQQALTAVNAFARELHSYAQRRQVVSLAGGAQVLIDDASGSATLEARLRDAAVNLLSVETTATGVIARVRVTGTLVAPFLSTTSLLNSFSELRPYERRNISLPGLSDEYLYKNGFYCFVSGMPGLYNALFAAEERESASGGSRIQVINATSNSQGTTTETWSVGGTTLTRVRFSPATSGTITYPISTTIPADVYRLFIEIFCPTTPAANARYLIGWEGQPQIAETITAGRSWYMPSLFVRDGAPITVTLQVQNVPNDTLVMPLVLIPTDGVSVWNIVTPPPLIVFHMYDPQYAHPRPFRTIPNGTIYGAPGFVSSRHLTVFLGATTLNYNDHINAFANFDVRSYRIEPAAFA
jgi:hypothetical protein